MRTIGRRAQTVHALSLIVVDYLQLMRPERRTNDRAAENCTLELAEMTRALKALARELDLPIVLISQLCRAVASRKDKRPQFSDLRESGAIEQDADMLLLLCRPAFYRELANKHPEHYAEVNIAKHRNGPTGW